MRPFVLTIAGFDPSAGAGVLSDVKTFECNKVMGLAACSAITYQNELFFDDLKWVGLEKIKKQIKILFDQYPIDFVKIGLIINLNILKDVILYLKTLNNDIKIIWDPILKASAGFEFQNNVERIKLLEICDHIHLITPNVPEIEKLIPDMTVCKAAQFLSDHCMVLLKSGHSTNENPIDQLFIKRACIDIYNGEVFSEFDKHGTGCVLSAAVTAQLALGIEIKKACLIAKKYVTSFILSNESGLGYHIRDYHLTFAN